MGEYNRVVPLVWALFGDEAKQLFPPLDLGKNINPADVIGAMWKTYAELAAARTTVCSGRLPQVHTRPGSGANTRRSSTSSSATLRPAMFTDPESERQVQDALETIFRVRALDFRREQQSVPYSSKRYSGDPKGDGDGQRRIRTLPCSCEPAGPRTGPD